MFERTSNAVQNGSRKEFDYVEQQASSLRRKKIGTVESSVFATPRINAVLIDDGVLPLDRSIKLALDHVANGNLLVYVR